MGIGQSQNINQVYFDPQTKQYYTANNAYGMSPALGINNYARTFLNDPLFNTNKQQSPINSLLAQALAAKPNAPTMGQLFPGMSTPNMGGGQGILGQGQYGAGRFLGNNIMGNPSLTSTAMNT